jgi:hypothetical protein
MPEIVLKITFQKRIHFGPQNELPKPGLEKTKQNQKKKKKT